MKLQLQKLVFSGNITCWHLMKEQMIVLGFPNNCVPVGEAH